MTSKRIGDWCDENEKEIDWKEVHAPPSLPPSLSPFLPSSLSSFLFPYSLSRPFPLNNPSLPPSLPPSLLSFLPDSLRWLWMSIDRTWASRPIMPWRLI